MLLTMAQTWHQVRPGEVRADCGGCHAHSQQPTPFSSTRAGQPDFVPFDLTTRTPLVTTAAHDESGKKWDRAGETGLRYEHGPTTVEYTRDIKPILERSCQPCHSERAPGASANLVLDDEALIHGVPGTYYRLALDHTAQFGYKPIIQGSTWRQTNASRYIRMFQSRRSLLIWKIFGRRTDGWTNDDFPTETVPGDPSTLRWRGQSIPATPDNRNRADLDYTGSVMPPAAAVAGTYTGPDGGKIKVAPLTDEDRLTFVRWIDLGCPIDLVGNSRRPASAGWLGDVQPPTLTLTYPTAGRNPSMSRLLVGMQDYETGLDMTTFEVVADFPVNGTPPGQNLAALFKPRSPGVWELRLAHPITSLAAGHISMAIKDRQGNLARLERTFSVTVPRR
jgi:hypothetical protein